MSVLALIPARGGSKGIPRKNVLPVCGKPMIGWTIEAALQSRHVERVVVSTDDEQIAAVSSSFGADVVRRPADISGDLASSEDALLHAVRQLQEQQGYHPDLITFLQCTSPLTAAQDIDGTIEALREQEADTALAVTDFHYFLWQRDSEGATVGINHDKSRRQLRQERTPQYLETGAIYAMRTAGFVQHKHRFFGKTAMYVMPGERCLEVDDPVDLKVAEMLLREQMSRDALDRLPPRISAVVFDFDGVFTDNRVLVSQLGEESVWCNRGDGWGISELRQTGMPLLVLSTEENPVVRARCEKLKIPCIHGSKDKAAALQRWLKQAEIDAAEVIYLGNDANDIGCLELSGCGAVVADAHPRARASADLILQSSGGDGAVRELTDLVMRACREGRRSASEQPATY